MSAEHQKAVLGAMLLDPDALKGIVPILRPDDFSERNSRVYEAAADLHGQGKPADIMTVVDRMGELGLLKDGDVAYVSGLTNNVPVTANAMFYAESVRSAACRRALWDAAEILKNRLKDPSVTDEEAMAQAEDAFGMVRARERDRVVRSKLAEDWLYEHFQGPDEEFVPSGFTILDRLLDGGFRMGGYTVVTGKSGSGKSTLISQVVLSLLMREQRVWIGEFEMQPYRVGRTLMKQAGMMPVAANVEPFRNEVTHNNLFLSGTLGSLDPDVMAQEMEHHLTVDRVKHFVVDNLAVMESVEGGERYERQVRLMQSVLRFCMSNRVHFYLLAHLRKMPKTVRGAPGLEDIAGAGVIGHLAENGLLVTRIENKEEYQAVVTVLKSRTHGMGKAVRMTFDHRSERFAEAAQVEGS